MSTRSQSCTEESFRKICLLIKNPRSSNRWRPTVTSMLWFKTITTRAAKLSFIEYILFIIKRLHLAPKHDHVHCAMLYRKNWQRERQRNMAGGTSMVSIWLQMLTDPRKIVLNGSTSAPVAPNKTTSQSAPPLSFDYSCLMKISANFQLLWHIVQFSFAIIDSESWVCKPPGAVQRAKKHVTTHAHSVVWKWYQNIYNYKEGFGFFHLIKYQQTVKFNVSWISYAATMNKRLISKWTDV